MAGQSDVLGRLGPVGCRTPLHGPDGSTCKQEHVPAVRVRRGRREPGGWHTSREHAHEATKPGRSQTPSWDGSNLPSLCRGSSCFRPDLDTLKAADWSSWGRYLSRSLKNTKYRCRCDNGWDKVRLDLPVCENQALRSCLKSVEGSKVKGCSCIPPCISMTTDKG